MCVVLCVSDVRDAVCMGDMWDIMCEVWNVVCMSDAKDCVECCGRVRVVRNLYDLWDVVCMSVVCDVV